MKMHLNNILNQHKATKEEKQLVIAHFENQTASHNLVVDFLESLRKN
jgi:hydroxymethylglutaryl-CoA reductase